VKHTLLHIVWINGCCNIGGLVDEEVLLERAQISVMQVPGTAKPVEGKAVEASQA
jgi:hypothetical protein